MKTTPSEARKAVLYNRLSSFLPLATIGNLFEKGIDTEAALRDSVMNGRILFIRGFGPKGLRLVCERFGIPRAATRSKGKLPKAPSHHAASILQSFEPFENYTCKLIAGVYLLKSKSQIMYVGQSLNVAVRIGYHVAKWEFDEVSILPIRILTPETYDDAGLDRALIYAMDLHERSLIDHLRPPWNKV